MAAPLLSVCLITYNHVKFIRQAIEGVMMQQVNFSWELIIADDFSTDGTQEILMEYKIKYPDFIMLILQPENVGPAKNWMDLITTPKSKYTALLDGDDYWTDPLKLQKQIDLLESNPEYSMCFHQVEVIYDNGNRHYMNSAETKSSMSFEDLIKKNIVATGSCVFRKINDLPKWFISMPAGDWGLHLYNSTIGKVYYVQDCMGVYRIHKEGLWSKLSHRDMINRGVEVMKGLDKAFDYKYHEQFSLAIKERLSQLPKKKPLISVLFQKLKSKLSKGLMKVYAPS